MDSFCAVEDASELSVLNRYFGVMENGNVKIRGLEIRRSDTPGFVFDAQTEMIDALKPANNTTELYQRIPEALKVLKNYRQTTAQRRRIHFRFDSYQTHV